MDEEMVKKLQEIVGHIKIQEPMKNHTSFRIGGPADLLIEIEKPEQAADVLRILKDHGEDYMIMGNGSNLLVSDKGIRKAVIKISGLTSAYVVQGETITAQAGILLSRLATVALKEGLSGLEFASGIPGTLGGGVFMNAGAYGGEMKDVVKSVTYMDEAGAMHTIGAEELEFGYRRSVFTGKNWIILSCTLQLKRGQYEDIRLKMADLTKRRTEKQPLSMPSAGSVFKRPEGHFAGKLIEDAGLKGYIIGGAMVSEKHSGFIVNRGGATAADVTALIRYIQQTVEEKFAVHLEPEIKLIGE